MKNFCSKFLLFLMLAIVASSCSSHSKSPKNGDGLYRIAVGDKFGFMDADGNVVIEPKFDKAQAYFYDGVCVAGLGEIIYIIDSKGAIVKELPAGINYFYSFDNGLAVFNSYESITSDDVKLKMLWHGVMNTKGEFIVPAENYDTNINIDGDSVYIVVQERPNIWYMADKYGKIIGEKCDSIWHGYSRGLCGIKKNGKWGYMNTSGQIVIDTIYDAIRTFSEDNIARVRKNGQEMYIDQTGNSLITVDKTLTGFTANRAAVIINDTKCLIDRNGNKICHLDCDKIYGFAEDSLCTIIIDNKALKINTLGNVVLRTNHKYIDVFQNGVAFFRTQELKWGLIDINGQEIIKATFDNRYTFDNDNIIVFSKQIHGVDCFSYFDKEGNLIWQDAPTIKVPCPRYAPTKADFIEYFDANIASLDPIEGIYYATDKNYYEDRDNPNRVGLNSTNSSYYAIARVKPGEDEFHVFCADGSNMMWVNKFTRLGESNNYAITKRDLDVNYSSDGMLELEDPNKFKFRLETGKNGWYNFFVVYEFIRDYPSASDAEMYRQAEWTGTGFALADGYIATNYHVTNGAKNIWVKGINGDIEKSYKGIVVASDKAHDLAIIKIFDSNFKTFGKIPYGFGKTSANVGEDVFVLGYPLTTTMGNEVKVTNGIISSSSGYRGDDSMYQISAPVQPGNSGGPLFDNEGNVVGVVCSKHKDAENANYAIKILHLYNLLESSDYKIELPEKNSVKDKKLSSKVKKIQPFVYLIECSSH